MSHAPTRHSFILLTAMVLVLIIADAASAVRPYVPAIPDPVIEEHRWRSFTELIGKGLRCVTEGGDGAIWFGVDEGAVRYDGYEWKTYTPNDGILGLPVNSLFTASDGTIYAGTEKGISVFRGSTWESVFPSREDIHWFVQDLAQTGDGTMWAATSWGLLKLGDVPTLYTSASMEAALQTVAPDVRRSIVPADLLPAYEWGDGVGMRIVEETWSGMRMAPGERIVWGVAPGSSADASGVRAGDRVVAVNGQQLVTQSQLRGTESSTVSLALVRAGSDSLIGLDLILRALPGRYRELAVHDLFVDQDDAIWLGLDKGEIVRFRHSENEGVAEDRWRLYTEQDGLVAGAQPSIAQTRDGVIWSVSNDNEVGVNRFDGRTWKHQLLEPLAGSNVGVSILATDDNAVWVGGKGYLYILREGVWEAYDDDMTPLSRSRVISMFEASNGSVWLASLGREALRFDNSSRRWMGYEKLLFQARSIDGTEWFLTDDDGVISNRGGVWQRYGIEDGLMNGPTRAVVARDGSVWVGGTHHKTAATARFDGDRWQLTTHPLLADTVEERAVFESSNGDMWFGAGVGVDERDGHLGGILQYSQGNWIHHRPPEMMDYVYGIGETKDGAIWVGSFKGMRRFDGSRWWAVTEPAELAASSIDVLHSSADGTLWVGHRKYGLLGYNGEHWSRYPLPLAVANGRITSILQLAESNILLATTEGILGFDSQAWQGRALPPSFPDVANGGLRKGAAGDIWMTDHNGAWDRRALDPRGDLVQQSSIRYRPDGEFPVTEITNSVEEIGYPAHFAATWAGIDRWNDTPSGVLQYAWRMDDGDWSPYSQETSHLFLDLASGEHALEVKARDKDLNEDATPAILRFRALPPFWATTWFQVLVLLLLSAVGIQTVRVVKSGRSLRRANQELLHEVVERKRAEADLEEQRTRSARADRLRSLGEMAAGIAHELNQPLVGVRGLAEHIILALKRGWDLPKDKLAERATRIVEQADRMVHIIQHVRMFAREAGRPEAESVDVNDVVRSCEDLVGAQFRSHGIDLTVESAEELPVVMVNPYSLEEVLLNLINNARDAVEDRPSTDDNVDVPSVILRTGELKENGSTRVTIDVVDNGVGIPPDILDRIQEPFFTTKEPDEGTGLGLSISTGIVEDMGGDLKVSSVLDQGTTVRIELPADQGQA